MLAVVLGTGNWALKLEPVKKYWQKEIVSPTSNAFSLLAYFSGKRTEKPDYLVYGFLPYWTIDQSKHLQLDKLTDIAYFGLYLKKDGTFLKTLPEGGTEPGYNNWRNNKDLDELIKKSKDYGVRVSLTIISHDDEVSDAFLNCESCWATFVTSAQKELDFKGLKDLHLNVEYGGYVQDEKTRQQFTKFVQYTSSMMDKKYDNSFLVVSTFADAVNNPRISDVKEVAKYADGLFIMGYDFHRPQSATAGPVAPLDGMGTNSDYDIRNTVKDYLSVAPPNKIILGVPYYGYNWVVEKDEPLAKRLPAKGSDQEEPNPAETYNLLAANVLGASTGPQIIAPKPATAPDGERSMSQPYEDITVLLKEKKPTLKWDDLAQTPYFTYKSDETGAIREVYFDNVDSLTAKYEMIKQQKLAGVGIWALGYDGETKELWNLLGSSFFN